MTSPRRHLRPSVLLRPRSYAGVCLIFASPLVAGCPKICSDDGFAWQQDPSCLAQTVATETDPTVAGTETMNPTESTVTSGGGDSWCVDGDGDGFGDPNMCTNVPPGETPPDGTVNNDDDCDDTDGNTFPGSAPKDDPAACMKDADGDDWGDSDPPGGGGNGGPVPGTDCDDDDADTFVGSAPEDDPNACMKDSDDDDHGDSMPPAGVTPGSDCDDNNMSAWSSCDGCKDDDGDGWLSDCDSYPPDHPGPDCDDGDPNTFPGSAPKDDPNACMTDADDDDWGDSSPSNPNATPGTDCDDGDANTFPGSAPKDDPNACMTDGDGDDHGDAKPSAPGVTPGSDCYDANPNLNPSNTVLVSAVINTGDISSVDTGSGAVAPYASVDVAGIVPWIPTSVAVHPIDGTIYAALAFKDRLATLDYCGMGAPTLLAMPHKKNICGISFDRNGVLYGVDGQVDQLVTFNADGSIAQGGVKPLTFEGKTLNVADCGMAYDCHNDRLLVSDSGSGGIYSVNPADGVATRLADLPGEMFGAGLEYDPTTKEALSCDQTSFLSIALDGTNDFTALTDLSEPVDDLLFGPKCN